MQSRLGAGTQSTWADRPSSRGGVRLRYGIAPLVDVKAINWPTHIGTYGRRCRAGPTTDRLLVTLR